MLPVHIHLVLLPRRQWIKRGTRWQTLLGCTSDEIIFTSGATESDNLAIRGAAYANRDKGNHIITSAAEHHAILDTCHALATEGFETTYLPVDKYGMVSPDNVENAITQKTILMSFMYANNEVGTINPIREIANIASKHDVVFHSDAVQGIGKLESDMDVLGLDMASITAHKMYGPKGIGALYIRKGNRLAIAFIWWWSGIRHSPRNIKRSRNRWFGCSVSGK